MTQMLAQASKDTVVTACEKILPFVILLEDAVITVVHIMANQKGTKISSKKSLCRLPKSLSNGRVPVN